jgi:hypothetical protein
MRKVKQSVSGDNALREFYLSCGLDPQKVEIAIKMRYDEPLSCIQAARRATTWKANRLAKLAKDNQ